MTEHPITRREYAESVARMTFPKDLAVREERAMTHTPFQIAQFCVNVSITFSEHLGLGPRAGCLDLPEVRAKANETLAAIADFLGIPPLPVPETLLPYEHSAALSDAGTLIEWTDGIRFSRGSGVKGVRVTHPAMLEAARALYRVLGETP